MINNKILIKVKGRNINRFIRRLISLKINILKIKKISEQEANFLISITDYQLIIDNKTIYEVVQLNIYGIIKLQQFIKTNKYILIYIVCSILLITLLSNMIFKVEVVHNSQELRNIIIQELSEHGISKFNFKKSYDQLQIIKHSIKEKYKSDIEWIEIIEDGTSYIIKVEQRIINQPSEELKNSNIVASKSAIIKSIIVNSGEVVKNINDYVLKDEVIISGNIHLYDEVKDQIPASGIVYGEVWYTINIFYPFNHNYEYETNKINTTYAIKFLNYQFEFNKKFINKNYTEQILINHQFLPFSFVKQEQRELVIVNEILTKESAIEQAIQKGNKIMEDNLKQTEHIIKYNILNTTSTENGVTVEIFYSIYEDISNYVEIKEEINE